MGEHKSFQPVECPECGHSTVYNEINNEECPECGADLTDE